MFQYLYVVADTSDVDAGVVDALTTAVDGENVAIVYNARLTQNIADCVSENM